MTDDDKQLVGGILTGTGSDEECFDYEVDLSADGAYELIIRSAEPTYETTGSRVRQ